MHPRSLFTLSCALLALGQGSSARAQHQHQQEHESEPEHEHQPEHEHEHQHQHQNGHGHGHGTHGGHQGHGTGTHLHAGLSVELGEIEAFGGERVYRGGELMLGARRGQIELMAHLPLHYLELGADSSTGLGDLHLMAAYAAYSSGDVELGGAGGVMPPVGNDDDGLGMGHWMVMAGGFARARSGPWRADLSVSYGGALSSKGHAEHGLDVWPPVSPMNAHELRARGKGALAIGYDLELLLSLVGALPLGDGVVLGTVGGGLSYTLGKTSLGLTARHGLGGHTAGLMLGTQVMRMF